jgi:hypothetical protein
MTDISFEINGKKVNPNNIADALKSAMLQEIGESVKKAVGFIRCSKHNQAQKVIVKGQSLDNLSAEVTGCCNDIIKRVTEKLK